MGSIDFSSELADTYISQVRQIEQGGGTVRSRPAVNRDEALKAREVRRRVDRITLGYRGPANDPAELEHMERRCCRCGRLLPDDTDASVIRSVYTKHGRIDTVVCAGGCPSAREVKDSGSDAGQSGGAIPGHAGRGNRGHPGRKDAGGAAAKRRRNRGDQDGDHGRLRTS